MGQRWGWVVAAVVLAAPVVAQGPGTDRGKPQKPSQPSVAAKDIAFGSVTADAAEVKAAKKADDLEGAKAAIGKSATFVGTVTKVFQPKGNARVLLNFAKDYKKAITGLVDAADFKKFPDLTTLEGKRVLVTGKVSDFKGQPEVILTTPGSIKLVK